METEISPIQLILALPSLVCLIIVIKSIINLFTKYHVNVLNFSILNIILSIFLN